MAKRRRTIDRVSPARRARALLATAFVKRRAEEMTKALRGQFREAARRIGGGLSPVDGEMAARWQKDLAGLNTRLAMPLMRDAQEKTKREMGITSGKAATQAANPGIGIEVIIGMRDEADFILPARKAAVDKYLADTSRLETRTSIRRIDAIYKRSLVEQLTPRDIARQLLSEGLSESALRAQLLARTVVIWANNEGAMQGYQEAGVEVTRWLATSDDVTCEFCAQLDGRAVKIGDPFLPDGTRLAGLAGGTLNVPFDIDHPPAHPSCRCTTLAVTEPAEERIGRIAGEKLRAEFTRRVDSGQYADDKRRRAALLRKRRQAG